MHGDRGARADGAPLLAALQLGDSLFPSGGYTLSHGLETLAERGLIRDARALHDWIAATIRWQVGPSDGVAAAAAWDASHDIHRLARVDARLLATKLAREPREASVRVGRQVLATLDTITDGGLREYRRAVLAGRAHGLHPVVTGLAGRVLGLTRRDTVLLVLHQYVAGCLGAALRLVDVDDVEAQRIRLELTPDMLAAADDAVRLSWEEMYACAPQTELMTMLHERSTMRLFAS